MATTFVYKIRSLKTDPTDDNYIKEATVEIFGTEDSVTKSASFTCVFHGNKAEVGSDFQSLDDLKKKEGEAVIAGWMKTIWQEYKVKKYEAIIQKMIDDHNGKDTDQILSNEDTSYDAAPPVTPTPPTE